VKRDLCVLYPGLSAVPACMLGARSCSGVFLWFLPFRHARADTLVADDMCPVAWGRVVGGTVLSRLIFAR
jgi:hypothetical protein